MQEFQAAIEAAITPAVQYWLWWMSAMFMLSIDICIVLDIRDINLVSLGLE